MQRLLLYHNSQRTQAATGESSQFLQPGRYCRSLVMKPLQSASPDPNFSLGGEGFLQVVPEAHFGFGGVAKHTIHNSNKSHHVGVGNEGLW